MPPVLLRNLNESQAASNKAGNVDDASESRRSHVGQQSLGELQRRADIQIHYRGEHLEIHRINRLMPGGAHVVDDSKHVSAGGQVLGESIGLTLVCKVCLDKDSWKMSGELRATPMTGPTLLD